jgi:hypothetical protein
MKREPDVLALIRKQIGKDAAAILNQVDKMLRRGVSRGQIEKAVAVKLRANLRKRVRLFMSLSVPRKVCP